MTAELAPTSRRSTRRQIHGEYSSYTGGCRCAACIAACMRYAKTRTLRLAAGEWRPWTAAEPVRRHVASLRGAGMGWRLIADLAGVSAGNVIELVNDGRARVRSTFAAKLLSVGPSANTLDAAAGGAFVDSTGTRRRIQALVVLGWPIQAIATRLDTDRNSLGRILDKTRVRASTARAMRELYGHMWNRLPPNESRYERAAATRARAYAARNGWVSPLAWDDIDDPQAEPCGVKGVDR